MSISTPEPPSAGLGVTESASKAIQQDTENQTSPELPEPVISDLNAQVKTGEAGRDTDGDGEEGAGLSRTRLCRNGCGFFGDADKNGYCSKCHKILEKEKKIEAGNDAVLAEPLPFETADTEASKKRKRVSFDPMLPPDREVKRRKFVEPKASGDSSEPAADDESSDDDGGEMQWEVEKILNKRVTGEGKAEYMVKWKGWTDKWNGWEPEEHLVGSEVLVKAFEDGVVVAAEKKKKREMQAKDGEEGEIDDGSGSDEEEWEVEKILKKRVGPEGGTEYLVKWKGWEDKKDRTWEPEEHLEGSEKLVKNFEDKMEKKELLKKSRKERKTESLEESSGESEDEAKITKKVLAPARRQSYMTSQKETLKKAKKKRKTESSDESEEEALADSEQSEDWEVEKILKKRVGQDGGMEYLVKWKGWEDKKDRTWEPEEHLEGSEKLVKSFEAKLEKKEELKKERKAESTKESSDEEEDETPSAPITEKDLGLCDFCNAIFLSQDAMKAHMKEHKKKGEIRDVAGAVASDKPMNGAGSDSLAGSDLPAKSLAEVAEVEGQDKAEASPDGAVTAAVGGDGD